MVMNHLDQTVALLRKQIGNDDEVDDIIETAKEVASEWVDPASGGREQTNGLIYGLVQSGKTGVLTATGALGADEGYRTIIVLTSDSDPLYDQTLARVQEAFPGIDIIAKTDIRDLRAFIQRIRSGTCAIVATKNGSILDTLVENFKQGNVRGLSCLIIDDEADQASLNTRERRADGSRSTINDLITSLRRFFEKNTYLQVTATPQALFLQTPDHAFRPNFTVLSHPGAAYVGGDDFFGAGANLVREFDINDIASLTAGNQPTPTLDIPASLLRALDTFMLAATYKRRKDADQNCAFLCHVSTRTADHNHIVNLLRRYKTDLTVGARSRNASVVARLKNAYDDLAATHTDLRRADFEELLEAIAFFAPGITVKLVNGETDEDVAVRSPYNLFVGGNKLGRGVTIKNLLVSYYGRNPRRPQSDTVLQHARMYGYRRSDIGLLRLFLPRELHVVFRAIHNMERSLRELIARAPSEEFRGIYLEGSLSATRANVLAPGAVGVYAGGGVYNPAQVLREGPEVAAATQSIDERVAGIANKSYQEFPIRDLQDLIRLTMPDQRLSERIWDPLAVAESIGQLVVVNQQTTGFVYVDRDRDQIATRRETQGILTGGESSRVPNTSVTLFLLRMKSGPGSEAAWWPQIRFPDGRYAFAFAI